MKAIVYRTYGPPDVLHLAEVQKPMPGEHEVLIKLQAATVTTGDCNVRGFTFVPPGFGPLPRLMFGFTRPKIQILGTELSGEIVQTGKKVSKFKIGDQVFGIDSTRFGAYAEFTCRHENSALTLKPSNMSWGEAAAIPFGAGTALYFLRDRAGIQQGQKVLIIGATGGVGSYAVQLARYFGAEVTAVCSSAGIGLAQTLGAHKTIDYTLDDYTQNGEKYDIIFDTVVRRVSFARNKKSLSSKGHYLAVAGGPKEMFNMLTTKIGTGKKVIFGTPTEQEKGLRYLKQLIEAGYLKAAIDRTYPLEQVAEAHRYVDTGHKKGNVVISISPDR